jgi:hypothetical protein
VTRHLMTALADIGEAADEPGRELDGLGRLSNT